VLIMHRRHESILAPTASARSAQAGFTLVELLVTLAITVLLMVAVLATFDFNGRIARVQTNVSEMQQSLRISQDDLVRMVRMAGRGNLPPSDATHPYPEGIAFAVKEDAGGANLVAGDDSTRVLAGTDVLTIRGVFSTLYQANTAGALALNPAVAPTTGTLVLSPNTPGGAVQDLQPLKTLIASSTKPEALLLVSANDDSVYAVVELDPAMSTANADGTVTLNFKISGGTYTADFLKLTFSGAFPADFKSAAYAGILEEHRYYVREEHAVASDLNSDLTPKLARGRFYPGTNTPWQAVASNARLDLADNILDLQVALGFDSSFGGAFADDADFIGQDDQLLETADGKSDDWLLNASPDTAVGAGAALQYLRVTTLARADRRDHDYQAPLLPARVEDHAYGTSAAANTSAQRMYRRRLTRTVIDLRNL
jgi:prepilin-type N-terminal cleavage/methylation domain-containing protein